MRTLILVDLDNVLRPDLPAGQRPPWWYLPASDGDELLQWRPSEPVATFVNRDDPSLSMVGTVFVIAFNEATASVRGREPLRARYLLNLADCLGALVGVAGEIRVEPILVRTVPQAADLALLTALVRSSDASCCGPFDCVVLMSGDTGLRDAVTAQLVGTTTPTERRRYLTWCTWNLTTPRHRAPPSPPESIASEGRKPAGWSASVIRPEHVAAVASESLAWFPTGEFSSLAARTQKRVEHLTTLGPTESTSRGVARLGTLLTAPSRPIRLGPLNPTDGVEWPEQGPLRGDRVRDPMRATIGEGAVRFPSIGATLPTRLPLPVIVEAAATGRLDAVHPFSDIDVLKCFRRTLVPVGDVRLKVRCERRVERKGDVIRFWVEATHGRLRGWWIDWDQAGERATSEIKTGAPPSLAIPSDTFDAELVVDARLSEPCVDIAAPNISELTAPRMTDGWELSLAAPDHRSALVLMPPRSMLPPAERLAVCRIQELGDPPPGWGFDEMFWYFLKRAPLLVPCQWARPSSVLAARGAT